VDAEPFDWTIEFDSKVKDAIDRHDTQSLAAPAAWGESLLASAHPTLEHYIPLLYCMGCVTEKDQVSYPHESLHYGSLSMRMALFEPPTQ
jgi:4,5-DOPA dioxygenase extradiol